LTDVTLGRFVRDGRFAGRFVDHYLVPIGAAIWSTPPGDMMHFPAETILRFFENHGLLALNGLPQWQTVVGGSHAYVNAFRRSFQGAVHLEARIEHVRREPGGVVVRMHDGVEHRFDRVVLAAHADEALRLLADATADERRLLGAWTYQRNLAVLHTDESVMPPNRRAWASWNYTRETGATDTTSLSMTYHMNRLQGLQTRRQYFVTLNRAKPIPEDRVIRAIQYTHPMFTFETVRTQKELSRLNDNGYTFFCGSYFGYGFHEDAVRSAVAVAHRFGLEL
jgi:predicted NAD/FAD-binding protein